jgi:hypothetical protein
MDDETGPITGSVQDVDQDVGASCWSRPVITGCRGSGFESRSHLLSGFDVDPAVDPHHVVITPEIQCSGLPDQLASGGEVVTVHLIQPLVEALPQLADQWGAQGNGDQFGLVLGEPLRSSALRLQQHVYLRSGQQTFFEGQGNQGRLSQSVGSGHQPLRLAGM